jgi:hypothetical protein
VFSGSVYPAASVSPAPRGVCRKHRDAANSPGAPCSITPFGRYNSKLGSHLILFELKLVVEFPAGCTILIPSGGITHGNTDIQDGKVRHALIQFCAGGLARWISYGFSTWGSLSAGAKKSELVQRVSRCKEVLARFSTMASLAADRAAFNTGFICVSYAGLFWCGPFV